MANDTAAYSVDCLAGDAADGSDLDAVAAIAAASFTHPWTRDMLARELRESAVARLYILRRGDASVAAFCACWMIAGELHINTIAVNAADRRRGLATRLLRAVLADASARGAGSGTLEVRRSNDAARRLYEGLGFTIEAVRPRYYADPVEDALILWRRDLDRALPPGPGSTPEPHSGP